MKFIPLLLALALAPAAAEDTPPPSVEVATLRDPAFKPYRIMLRGLDAFEKHHALAPQADLRFLLNPEPGIQREGLELRIAGDNTSIPVPLNEKLVFELPRNEAAATDDADLRTNRKRGAVKWWPYIRSPGIPTNSVRWGDLKLECQVFWAISREDASLLMRARFALGGDPCGSSWVKWWEIIDRPLASAQLRDGARVVALKLVEDKKGYYLPMADQSWSDEAVVELTYLSSTQP